MTKQAEKTASFEKSVERLETIVREMESGAMNLDKLMSHFEEGMGLVKACSDKLNEVERKIEVLVKKGDQLVTEPFEAEDEGNPAGKDVTG
ncbi:MAG: exodeoxyribonuclease VII small subunit [Lentisphaerae bacterium]|nr:exodeoxyribonuclease VII small subunit [Lentisphaerota bacterium]